MLRFGSICLAALFVAAGSFSCAKNPAAGGEQKDVLSAESTLAMKSLAMSSEALYVIELTTSLLRFVPGVAKTTAAFDTLFANTIRCPHVLHDPLGQTLVLDFGTGCRDDVEKSHSGQIQVLYNGRISQGASVSYIFQDFTSSDRRFSGKASGEITGETLQLTIYDITARTAAGAMTLSAALMLQATLNSDLDPEDDFYLARGNFAVIAENGEEFRFTLTEPFNWNLTCAYPARGTLTVATSQGFSGFIEFTTGGGACDDALFLTVGEERLQVSLADF